MSKFFGRVEIDPTFVNALEKRLVAVYGHESKREWRSVVLPMATFGALLILVIAFLGKQYIDTDKGRNSSSEYQQIDSELDQVQRDLNQDSDINQAIEYVSM